MHDTEHLSSCAALQGEALGAQKELAKLRAELALAKSANLASEAVQLDSGARMLVAQLDGADNKSLQVVAVMLLVNTLLLWCTILKLPQTILKQQILWVMAKIVIPSGQT